MKNNQKGFGLVEGFLLLVLVGIIGFVGWYVYKARNNALSTYDNSTKSLVVPNKKASNAQAAKPEVQGELEYKNTDIGFSFEYPAKWGAATLQNGTEDRSGILFATDNHAHIILLNKKTIGAVLGTDSPQVNLYGYTVVDGDYFLLSVNGEQDKLNSNDVLYSSSENLASYLIYNGVSLGNFVGALAKLDNNKDYDSVIFRNNNEVSEKFTQNSPEAQEMLSVLKTFKNL